MCHIFHSYENCLWWCAPLCTTISHRTHKDWWCFFFNKSSYFNLLDNANVNKRNRIYFELARSHNVYVFLCVCVRQNTNFGRLTIFVCCIFDRRVHKSFLVKFMNYNKVSKPLNTRISLFWTNHFKICQKPKRCHLIFEQNHFTIEQINMLCAVCVVVVFLLLLLLLLGWQRIGDHSV